MDKDEPRTEKRAAGGKPSLAERYRLALERNPDPRLRLLDQAMREEGIDLEESLRREDAERENDAPTEQKEGTP